MFTPQEIQEQTFSKAVFGGYDMQQVDDFLEPLTEDYITLYKENSVLKAKMKILVEKLEEYLTAQHVCNVCACITYPNPPSIAFHEKHGYKTVAHFHASGYKQDAWHDMIWMEKTLCPHTIPPRPFIPFPEL